MPIGAKNPMNILFTAKETHRKCLRLSVVALIIICEKQTD